MAKLFYALVVSIIALIGLTFTYMNSQTVEIRYLLFSGKIPLSVLLLITLVVGMLAGLAGSFVSLLRSRRNLNRMKKELVKYKTP